ncbi:AAA family ATPase [Flaviflexus equikiangi]|uniref:MoxR family ATPase n=1 Tax=Flaviflexus equikiangi TaxID=2758573 RepID=A0ABS2TKM6_9ACTO|nr:MoxR family ATPase [Flaviflexus equikiangi]MBM9433844.1 MoxR family ATPase [Flaviflexus equikiangi]
MTSPSFRPPLTIPSPVPDASDAQRSFAGLAAEIHKAVVGQDEAVAGLLVGLLSGGHVLLEGVPGTAKTLLVRSLSAALTLDNSRIQFTPDLMPGDLTGSLVYRSGQFDFRPGPVFTNLLLADEINRTPPKTQAALLEAMAEHRVTVDGEPRPLPDPFMVVATQNPIEYDGTYPLPEAQLDRFLLKVTVDLPSREDELDIVRRHADYFDPNDLETARVAPVAGAADITAARSQIRTISVHPAITAYIVDLVRATRSAPPVEIGVSPRGATALLRTAQAWAWLSGRTYATPDDVKALAVPALVHRVRLRAEAELDGLTPRRVIDTVLAQVPVPR